MSDEDAVVEALAVTIDQVLTEQGTNTFLLLIVRPPDDNGRFSARAISPLPPEAQRDVLAYALKGMERRLAGEKPHHDA